jgi:predicted small metal-binding protein
MKKKLIAALLMLAFGLAAPSFTLAADTAMTESVKQPMYTAKYKGFTVKGHDKDEVIAILKEHARSHHNGTILSDTEVEALIKTTEPKK